jgi:hypothetical protein
MIYQNASMAIEDYIPTNAPGCLQINVTANERTTSMVATTPLLLHFMPSADDIFPGAVELASGGALDGGAEGVVVPVGLGVTELKESVIGSTGIPSRSH